MMRPEWLAPVAAALLLAPTAHADEPGLEVSRDGRTWSSGLSGPLLDEDVRLVPGAATRADLWLRNSSEHTVTMTAVVTDARTSLPDEVAPRDDFRASVAGTRVTGEQSPACRVVVRDVLEPHEQRRVPVVVRLPGASRNVSQGESVTLALRVQLVAGEAADPCSGSGGPDEPAPPEPPERPGTVDTDGGFMERPAVGDALALGLGVALVLCVLSRRGRAHRGRPAN